MKKTAAKEIEDASFQGNDKFTEEQIDRTLGNIHKGMIDLFGVDFPFFSKVKVIKHQEIIDQLSKRMRDDLKEGGIQWRQPSETLTRSQTAELPQYYSFYSPRDDVLYMNEKMVTLYPEKLVSVCAHELAEKLLFACVSPPMKSFMQPAVKLYFEAKKTSSTKRLQELLNVYVDTVFKTVFKEGCCEAIAVQTLRNTHYAAEAASLEKELQAGHSKCIDLLSHIDNARKSGDLVQTTQERRQALDQSKPTPREIIRTSQMIKSISYYLGYPLAKAVLEKYGIEGMISSLKKNPPLKAQYFGNPATYLVTLEKLLIPS